MFERRALIAIAIAFVCLCPIASSQTLQESVQAMMDEYPKLHANRADIQIWQDTIRLEKSALRPKVGLSLRGGEERFFQTNSHSFGETGNAGLQGNQLIYDGGAVKNRIREAQAMRYMSETQLEETRQTLTLELATAYVNIIKYRRLIDFASSNIHRHREVLRKTSTKHDAGAAPRADVELVRARIAMAEATLEGLRRQLGYAVNTFQKLTGQHPGELVEPDYPEWALPSSIDEVNLALNPKLQTARYKLAATEAKLNESKSSFRPTLNFTVQGDASESDKFPVMQENASAMLVLSYDVFGGGRRKAELGRAATRLSKVEYELSDTRLTVENQFLDAWNDLAVSNERLLQLKEYHDAMESVVSAYQRQFELGRIALLNVLDIENELFSAKSSLEEERLTRLQAAYKALAATGDLLNTLNL